MYEVKQQQVATLTIKKKKLIEKSNRKLVFHLDFGTKKKILVFFFEMET